MSCTVDHCRGSLFLKIIIIIIIKEITVITRFWIICCSQYYQLSTIDHFSSDDLYLPYPHDRLGKHWQCPKASESVLQACVYVMKTLLHPSSLMNVSYCATVHHQPWTHVHAPYCIILGCAVWASWPGCHLDLPKLPCAWLNRGIPSEYKLIKESKLTESP